ncbi:hypothetical protein [Streptococcus ovis]|uniref:hypothetical protein n=1 Tax=Streptococcus ovis TaxID=82806 RepID=UPI000368FAF4|nr:hypothetical protein [Streptococcus ovis]
MKKIFQITWYKKRYHTHVAVNGLFYYLRRIPFIGKKIPEAIYRNVSLKYALFLIFSILAVPIQIFAKFFWLGLYLALAIVGIHFIKTGEPGFTLDPQAWPLALIFWILLAGVILHWNNGFSSSILKTDRDFLQNFGLSRRQFVHSELFVEPLLTSLYYLPALLVFTWLSKQWFLLPAGLLTIPALRLGGASLIRICFIYHIPKKISNYVTYAVTGLAILGFGLSFFFYKIFTADFFLVLLLLWIGLFIVSLRYLLHFQATDGFLSKSFEDSLADDKVLETINKNNEYTRQGLDMQKKLRLGEEKDLSHLTGMAYLNALLFQRYRTILQKKLLFRLGILAVIAVAVRIFLHFGMGPLKDKHLISIMPFLFMVMYLFSLGKALAQMVFVNCDIAMLHYPFYRESGNIISGFNYRFLQSVKYNSCFAIGIFLTLLTWGHFGYSLGVILTLALLLSSLTALLSFHDLFIYYVLQPFTKDMEVVNPLYKILSGATYWAAYLSSQLDVDSLHYAYIISGALLLYVGVGYLILLKQAPKTFVLKS